MSQISFIPGIGPNGPSVEESAKRSTQKYVRGEDAVGIYEDFRNPTGHIMTAWEAYTTFGPEALEEAWDYGSAILHEDSGEALKWRRKALNLSRKSVARAALVNESDMKIAETVAYKVPIQKLERIALALGLDERLLSVEKNAGGDAKLACRLRKLRAPARECSGAAAALSPDTTLLLAETAAIVRVQHRLQKWLGLSSEIGGFQPCDDYGSPQNPAWRVGRDLADDARRILAIGDSPIRSMRELVEVRLGIPVVQARLPETIAGATVMTTDENGDAARGVVLNVAGANRYVWPRRATLALGLGHILYDSDEHLQRARVHTCEDIHAGQQSRAPDLVEQRANAFASAFLTPNDSVRKPAPPDNWVAVDPFPIPETPLQRRGRFAGIVAASYDEGLITEHTAALYLGCEKRDVIDRAKELRELYGV